ncbi:hypothetical protein, partial [Pseudomonas flexibilis]|uniref:hypothetical protein n=1 Tax=Pseudomonas flexibilis TaxID=706570 RepID=UPI001BDC0863
MNRSAQLDTLAASLMELTEVLSLDPHCQWRRHFEQCLATTRQLNASYTHPTLPQILIVYSIYVAVTC